MEGSPPPSSVSMSIASPEPPRTAGGTSNSPRRRSSASTLVSTRKLSRSDGLREDDGLRDAGLRDAGLRDAGAPPLVSAAAALSRSMGAPARGQPRPLWQRDADAPKCGACLALFSFRTRRHHCRACGRIFCNACSAVRVPLPRLGYADPQRVCSDCFRRVGVRDAPVDPSAAESASVARAAADSADSAAALEDGFAMRVSRSQDLFPVRGGARPPAAPLPGDGGGSGGGGGGGAEDDADRPLRSPRSPFLSPAWGEAGAGAGRHPSVLEVATDPLSLTPVGSPSSSYSSSTLLSDAGIAALDVESAYQACVRCVLRGDSAVLARLIAHHRSVLLRAGADRAGLLHLASARPERADVLHVMLEFDSLPPEALEMRDALDCTPLLVAAKRLNVEALKRLLLLGANPDAQDVNGQSPLHHCCLAAAREEFAECVQLLVAHRCRIDARDAQGMAPLHVLARVPLLGGSVNACDLPESVSEVLDLLLACGADLNVVEEKMGRTPLHVACACGNVEVFEGLMRNLDASSLLVPDRLGNTPLHICSCYGNVDGRAGISTSLAASVNGDGFQTIMHRIIVLEPRAVLKRNARCLSPLRTAHDVSIARFMAETLLEEAEDATTLAHVLVEAVLLSIPVLVEEALLRLLELAPPALEVVADLNTQPLAPFPEFDDDGTALVESKSTRSYSEDLSDQSWSSFKSSSSLSEFGPTPHSVAGAIAPAGQASRRDVMRRNVRASRQRMRQGLFDHGSLSAGRVGQAARRRPVATSFLRALLALPLPLDVSGADDLLPRAGGVAGAECGLIGVALAKRDEQTALALLEICVPNVIGDLVDASGNTLLHLACGSGMYIVAGEILRRHLVHADRVNSNGRSPLHVLLAGISSGPLSSVATSSDGRLHLTALLQSLLQGSQAADPLRLDGRGLSPLMHLCRVPLGFFFRTPNMAPPIRASTTDDDESMEDPGRLSPRRVRALRLERKKRAAAAGSVASATEPACSYAVLPSSLVAAASFAFGALPPVGEMGADLLGCVDALLQSAPSALLQTDAGGSTPLHMAAELGNVHFVHCMLARTPGHIAARALARRDANGLSVTHAAVEYVRQFVYAAGVCSACVTSGASRTSGASGASDGGSDDMGSEISSGSSIGSGSLSGGTRGVLTSRTLPLRFERESLSGAAGSSVRSGGRSARSIESGSVMTSNGDVAPHTLSCDLPADIASRVAPAMLEILVTLAPALCFDGGDCAESPIAQLCRLPEFLGGVPLMRVVALAVEQSVAVACPALSSLTAIAVASARRSGACRRDDSSFPLPSSLQLLIHA